MGLRSGEFPGQSITFNFASWKSSSLFQIKTRDNILLEFPPPSGNAFLISEMAFLSITSMYLYKFIIPSIGISEATTEKLKLRQNIFLGSFTSSFQWAGLNCSRFLILMNLLYFHGIKNGFHLKTALFPASTVQYLGYVLHILSFSTSLQCAAPHCTSASVNPACTTSFCKSKLVFLA